MVLSDVSVKRPVLAAVVSLLLVVFGILAFRSLPLREYPDISPPVVSISTRYAGASADVVESQITEIIEDRISGIEGVRSIESTSRQGQSHITIEFNLDRDVDVAANDVRDRVSRLLNNLPDDADPPEIAKADTEGDVQVWIHMTSPTMSQMELTDYAKRNIADQLSVLDGVAAARVMGQQPSMRIWLNKVAMAARGITVQDVEAALRSQNVEFPAGRVESTEREFTVRVIRSYSTPDEFSKMVLKRGDDGHLVRLGEIAKVEVAPDNIRTMFRGNGNTMIGIGIIKQSKANALDVSRLVNAEVERIRPTLPEDMELVINVDDSIFIREALKEVFKTLGIAMMLVVGVIYLFLGTLRATIIPAITVPVCLISSFILMAALGYSVNLLTLLALVLAIGLVVDDAIVVLENIHRRIELGESRLVAAYRGARQVSFAVIATTLVLVAVFVPIMFLGGNIGRMFAELAAALGASVLCSAFVALSLTPMMCSKLLSESTERQWLARHVDDIFTKLSAAYRKTLTACLPHPMMIGSVLLAAVGLSVVLYRVVPHEYVPNEDKGLFRLMFEAPQGSSFDYTKQKGLEIEKILMGYIGKGEVHRIIARIPGFNAGEAVNGGQFTVSMKPWNERHRTTAQFAQMINQKVAVVPGIEARAFAQGGISMRGGGQAVQFVLEGTSYEELAKWRDIILSKARENPGLTGVNADYKETKPELVVNIDKNRAADLGVSISNIGRTLETMLNSRRVTTYSDRGEEYDVILQGRDQDRQSPHDLSNIYVRSEKTGQLIPMSNLITFVDRAGPESLNRYNRYREITISAGLEPGYRLGDALDYLNGLVKADLPQSARVDYKGESKEFQDSSNAAIFSFGMALLVVFLVLAAQFESFVHPLVIILTVPLAVAGALAGLYLFNNSLNVYSQIGIVMLVGIAAKNGILIVEFANQLRDQGRDIQEALLEAAGIRLRPILMTAVATMFGAIPLAMATGAGAMARVSLGIVVFSGVMCTTALTLFVVPVFYNLLARYTSSPKAVEQELERGLRQQPAE